MNGVPETYIRCAPERDSRGFRRCQGATVAWDIGGCSDLLETYIRCVGERDSRGWGG